MSNERPNPYTPSHIRLPDPVEEPEEVWVFRVACALIAMFLLFMLVFRFVAAGPPPLIAILVMGYGVIHLAYAAKTGRWL